MSENAQFTIRKRSDSVHGPSLFASVSAEIQTGFVGSNIAADIALKPRRTSPGSSAAGPPSSVPRSARPVTARLEKAIAPRPRPSRTGAGTMSSGIIARPIAA